MNKHVETMKNAVTNYRKTVRAAIAKMDENTRLYKPEEADKANAAIMAQLEKDRDTVKGLIAEARDAGQRDVDAWGKLDGAKITDDAKLLDAGAVNPDQFRGLVQKYQDNSTMLQLLANYAEKQNGESGGFSAVWNYGGKGNVARQQRHFDTSGLPTVESKRAAFNNAAAAAMNMADSIGDLTPGKLGRGPENAFLDAQLESFGAAFE